MKRIFLHSLCMIISSIVGFSSPLMAQDVPVVKRKLQLWSREAKEEETNLRLLPSEEDQEVGNAVPVLLRITYEQQNFMKDVYPKLNEYAEMDLKDPKLHDLHFNLFAKQIIRAGSMSFADWQYPLRSENPYSILLPDIQSQRHLVGRGMTGWIKQRLSKGEIDQALEGIQAQLSCARHCAATPVVVCHLVGLAIANIGFENLELAIQTGNCPNMYWALAKLSPTLHDLGPMVRWELWASPARLKEPVPPIGDDAWVKIANQFVQVFAEMTDAKYTVEESIALKRNMDRVATLALSESMNFSETEVERMTVEERIMRWLDFHHRRFRTHVEPLAYQTPMQVIAAKAKIEAENNLLLESTGAKTSPYPIVLTVGILACRNFERRAKFLQTIEAIRDHMSKNKGHLPEKLIDLELPAPNDPFTEKPFLYELNGKTARLRYAQIEGYSGQAYDYELAGNE